MKYLIVNADDLGYSQGVNEGIIYAHENGIVTSTSLMVYGKAANQAVTLTRKYTKLGLGLHFQIGKEDQDILTRQLTKTLAITAIENTKKEFNKQIELFTKMIGKLPDHIDGHYHVHKLPLIFPFIRQFARKNNIPLRDDGIKCIKTFFDFRGESKISVEALTKILRELPEGTSELMCHPAKYTSDLNSSYKRQREVEFASLTSNKVRQAIKELGIKLINWSEVRNQ